MSRIGRFLIKAVLFQIGVYPVRYSETRHAEVAKRTFALDDYAELCDYFGAANRREVHWSAATVNFPLTIASTRDFVPCITLTWTRIPVGL